MNIVDTLKSQLESLKINDSFFQFYTYVNSFKIKFFAPVVFTTVLSWVIYWLFHYHSHFDSFQEWLFIIFLGCIAQPLGITFFLSHITPVNGTFFKTVSRLWSENRTLKSFIDSADYQDSVLSSLFENKEFKNSILSFYKFLDSINFATSYGHNEVNHTNKEIKAHYDKIKFIIESKNKESFISFFKKNFINDFSTYSTHEKVIEFLKSSNSYQTDSVQPGSDLIEAIQEELKLKDKFKKVL